MYISDVHNHIPYSDINIFLFYKYENQGNIKVRKLSLYLIKGIITKKLNRQSQCSNEVTNQAQAQEYLLKNEIFLLSHSPLKKPTK